MKITHIDLISGNEHIAEFSFNDPSSLNPYMARAIVGIDADEIVPKYYGVGSSSNRKFYDFIRREREVIVRIVLNPNRQNNLTYSDLRDDLYRAISSSRFGDVELHFKQDSVILSKLSGRIVKFEVPHFSETPEVQITIKCEDGMLRGYEDVVLGIDDILIGGPGVRVFDAESTAPHGAEFKVEFTASAANFIIKDPNDDWEFKVIHSFLNGDILRVNSDFGKRSVILERASVYTKLADKIVPSSVWPVIFPNNNEFEIGDITKYGVTEVTYKTAYWGV